MATFKDRIEKLWENAKDADYRMTQTEFASKFGATRDQLKGWLSGAGEPKTDMLNKIAQACGVTADYLLGRTEDPHGLVSLYGFLADNYHIKGKKISPEIEPNKLLQLVLQKGHTSILTAEKKSAFDAFTNMNDEEQLLRLTNAYSLAIQIANLPDKHREALRTIIEGLSVSQQ